MSQPQEYLNLKAPTFALEAVSLCKTKDKAVSVSRTQAVPLCLWSIYVPKQHPYLWNLQCNTSSSQNRENQELKGSISKVLRMALLLKFSRLLYEEKLIPALSPLKALVQISPPLLTPHLAQNCSLVILHLLNPLDKSGKATRSDSTAYRTWLK